MDSQLLYEGIAYVTHELGPDSHLWLDRKVITKNINLSGKKVMDFGCGMGSLSFWLAKHNCHVDGFDIDKNHIDVCNHLKSLFGKPSRVDFFLLDIIADPQPDKYDIIFLSDVVEHLEEKEIQTIFHYLADFYLKPGGILFISFPPWLGPYAGHVYHAIKIPWIQLFPQRWVKNIISTHNTHTVGRFDMLGEYNALNHMTYRKLMGLIRFTGLKRILRNSHSKLGHTPFLPFIVTKEILIFKKPV